MATKNPKIILDRNFFLVLRKEPTRTIWMCTMYFRHKADRCKCRIMTSGKDVYVTGVHNHEDTATSVNNGLSQSIEPDSNFRNFEYPENHFECAPTTVLEFLSFKLVETSVVYFDSGNKNPKLIVDGQAYRVLRKYGNKTVWRCTEYFGTRTDRCKSRLSTTGKNIIISSDPHNHGIIHRLDKFHQSMKCTNVNIIREVLDEYRDIFK